MSSSVSQLSVSPVPPLSPPQNIYPFNCPPGLHQKVAHLDSLALRGDDISQGLAESMPWKSLAEENEQNSFPSFDVELLKIFGQQIFSSGSSQNQCESVGAAMSVPSHALLKNGGIVGESLGIACVQNDCSLAVDGHMGPGMMHSSDVEPKSLSTADLEAVESSNPLSSVIRHLSDNVMAVPDSAMSATDKNSAAPGCFGSSKPGLPSALDVKEFIPGVPWKGILTDTSSKQDELDTKSGSRSAAVAFRDMVRCLAKGKEEADEGWCSLCSQ